MSDDQVQKIKERIDIVEIVSQYVKLTKAGKNYKGLSPFRKEKTPSFYVSPDKGMYYDFSSGQGGDIFTFVQQMEGLDFKGALGMLAERAGIELKRESKASKDARDRLYSALEEACAFYETKLSENAEALEYLKGRGLEEATMRQFRVGFAPDGWQAVREHLEHAGYQVNELETVGLVKKGERGSHYDRFRSRIMFPIMDPAGRVIAFSGRIFGEAAKDNANAKYLNSPETRLFDKGKVLYGYHIAKQYIRKYDFSILVEGQMDIVMSHQAGYTNTVAVSGTGLTDEHLALLDRLSKRLVMAFDADAAGVTSSGRAATLALARGMDVKVATVPLGKDPADCIQDDPVLWKDAVKSAQHIVDFYLSTLMREHRETGTDERQLVLRVRDTVLPFVARIQSAVDQAHFVRTIAQKLGIAESAVWDDVRAHSTNTSAPQQTQHAPAPLPPAQSAREHQPRKEYVERALAGFLFWQASCEPRMVSDSHVQERAQSLDVELGPVLARYERDRETLALEAELLADPTYDVMEYLDEHLRAVSREHKLLQRARLAEELRRAERDDDEARAREILIAYNELSRCIDTLASQ